MPRRTLSNEEEKKNWFLEVPSRLLLNDRDAFRNMQGAGLFSATSARRDCLSAISKARENARRELGGSQETLAEQLIEQWLHKSGLSSEFERADLAQAFAAGLLEATEFLGTDRTKLQQSARQYLETSA